MPYVLGRTKALKIDHPPAAPPVISIPRDIVITCNSPGGSLPLAQTSSFLFKDLMKIAVHRAHLFTHGKYDELMKSMNAKERGKMFSWLYQRWFFAYKTAKYWGRGPRTWTRSLLAFDTFQRSALDFWTRTLEANISASTQSDKGVTNACELSTAERPIQLCPWVIHLSEESFDKVGEEEVSSDSSRLAWGDSETQDSFDPNRDGLSEWPESWMETPFPEILRDGLDPNGEEFSRWPESWMETPFPEILRDGLETNSFSTLPETNFLFLSPKLSTLFVIRLHSFSRMPWALPSSPAMSAWCTSCWNQTTWSKRISQGFFYFTLAVTYLDASKVCCQLFSTLVCFGKTAPYLRQLYVDNLGHTVLDGLMMTILKSHTNIRPDAVEDSWKGEHVFRGAEVDICGRWDADSDGVRTLLENGYAVPPSDWKHKFCHASIQSICHCIRILFASSWSPDINTPSGLFLKRCAACGLTLQLRPLHTLVLTATHLAKHGSEDEDLFGMIACALCLISNGADPQTKASISLEALLGQESANACSHEELAPAALAYRLAPAVMCKAANVGWEMLCYILNSASAGSEDGLQSGTGLNDKSWERDCENDPSHVHPFSRSKMLATLWAIVQAEFLTYRRRKDEDAWHSENFDMCAVWESIKAESSVSSGFLEEKLLKPFCHCGRFCYQLWRNERIEDIWRDERTERIWDGVDLSFICDAHVDGTEALFPKRYTK